VLKQEIGEYENIDIEWIRGETPRASFRDSEGKTIKEVELTDVEHAGFLGILKSNGFVPTVKKVNYGQPIGTGSFNGRYYEYYDTLAPFELAFKFAVSLTNKTASTFIATITSKEEEDFIISLIPENTRNKHPGVWLGAQDVHEEGKWEWIGGPERGVTMWRETRAANEAAEKVKGQYSNWLKNEPNNANGEPFQEDCAYFKVDNTSQEGRWIDVSCFPIPDEGRALVVEYDVPEQPVLILNNQNQIIQVVEEQKSSQEQEIQQPQQQPPSIEKEDSTNQIYVPKVREFPLLSPLDQTSSAQSTDASVSSFTPKTLFKITLGLLFIFSVIFLISTFWLTPKRRKEIRVWSSTFLQRFQPNRRVDFAV